MARGRPGLHGGATGQNGEPAGIAGGHWQGSWQGLPGQRAQGVCACLFVPEGVRRATPGGLGQEGGVHEGSFRHVRLHFAR